MAIYCEHARRERDCPLCTARTAIDAALLILVPLATAKREAGVRDKIREAADDAMRKAHVALGNIARVAAPEEKKPIASEIGPAFTEREWADDDLCGVPASGGLTLWLTLDPDQFPNAPPEVSAGIAPERVHGTAALCMKAMRQDGHPAAIRREHIWMVEGTARGDQEAWDRFAAILRSYFPPEPEEEK